MPQEFHYPLTRYCLRGGAMTLPRAMVGLFPESGEFTALDTRSETEYTLTAVDPRTIAGLGPLFRQHRMAVNDELVIRPLEDGRFSITPVKRDHRPDYSSREALAGVLDELIAASVPVTEAEVRALYPGIPDALSLADVFAADQRFVRREGRWHNSLNLAYARGEEGAPRGAFEPAPSAAGAGIGNSHADTAAGPDADAAGNESDLAAVGSAAGSPAPSAAAAAGAVPAAAATPVDRAADRDAPESARASDDGRPTNLHAAAVAGTGAQPDVQAGLWQTAPGAGGHANASGQGGPGAAQAGGGRLPGTVLERRQPTASPGRTAPTGQRAVGGAAAAEEASQRSTEDDDQELDDGASLEVTELANRLRAVLGPVGFRIEPVARGQLLLTADMGRKSYTVLAQLLTRNDRLDWADLLARRRATNVRYLTVIGDFRALHRLTNPAELARATMWSWQALDRLATLQRTVSFSPIELESHFERDGLFEKGLERFEAAVAKRVAERGAVSELLSRLAVMRAPTVFLLEDLAGELQVPRDRLLRMLEMLAEAPFHLVAKIDQGEFVLRQRVADSLDNLTSYASSLRERLPTRKVERLTGLAEPDLLTEEEFEDQPTGP